MYRYRHRRPNPKLALLLVLLLACPLPTAGQLAGVQPVIEVGAQLTQSTITAIQSVITAANSVISVANQALELMPLDEIVLAAEFAETIALLQSILEEAGALAYDVESIQAQIDALFDLGTAPNTPVQLEERLSDMTTVIFQARTYALRVQTLLNTLLGALGHVLRLVQMIAILTGNHSSNSIIIQLLATLNTTAVTHTATATTWQRSDILKLLARDLVVASYNKIQAERWSDWPTGGGPS